MHELSHVRLAKSVVWSTSAPAVWSGCPSAQHERRRPARQPACYGGLGSSRLAAMPVPSRRLGTARRIVATAVAGLFALTAPAAATIASEATAQQPYSASARASAYPQTAWAPTTVSTLVQVGGSLTRSSATYTLERTASSAEGAQSWTVAVKGNAGGWFEATVGKGADKRKLDLVPAAVYGCAVRIGTVCIGRRDSV